MSDSMAGFNPIYTLVQDDQTDAPIERNDTLPNSSGTLGPIFIDRLKTPDEIVTLKGKGYTSSGVAAERAKTLTRPVDGNSSTVYTYTLADGSVYTGAVIKVGNVRPSGLALFEINITLYIASA